MADGIERPERTPLTRRGQWSLVSWSSYDTSIAALKCRDGRWLRIFFDHTDPDGHPVFGVQFFSERPSAPIAATWKVSIEPRFGAMQRLEPVGSPAQDALATVPPFLLEEAARKAIDRGPTSAKDYLRR